jgi:hypothetical protein
MVRVEDAHASADIQELVSSLFASAIAAAYPGVAMEPNVVRNEQVCVVYIQFHR